MVWKLVHLLAVFDFLLLVVIVRHLLKCEELEVRLLLWRCSVGRYLVSDLVRLRLLDAILRYVSFLGVAH